MTAVFAGVQHGIRFDNVPLDVLPPAEARLLLTRRLERARAEMARDTLPIITAVATMIVRAANTSPKVIPPNRSGRASISPFWPPFMARVAIRLPSRTRERCPGPGCSAPVPPLPPLRARARTVRRRGPGRSRRRSGRNDRVGVRRDRKRPAEVGVRPLHVSRHRDQHLRDRHVVVAEESDANATGNSATDASSNARSSRPRSR